MDTYARTVIVPDEALYRLLLSAARQRLSEVDVSALAPDEEAVARARIAVMRHPQLRGVANMTLSGTTVSLEYAGRQDGAAWQQMIADFEALAAGILEEAAQQGPGQRAQALYVYQYLVNNVAFVQGGAADGWGALTSGQAIAPSPTQGC
jgi:hypothetical protein